MPGRCGLQRINLTKTHAWDHQETSQTEVECTCSAMQCTLQLHCNYTAYTLHFRLGLDIKIKINTATKQQSGAFWANVS